MRLGRWVFHAGWSAGMSPSGWTTVERMAAIGSSLAVAPGMMLMGVALLDPAALRGMRPAARITRGEGPVRSDPAAAAKEQARRERRSCERDEHRHHGNAAGTPPGTPAPRARAAPPAITVLTCDDA